MLLRESLHIWQFIAVESMLEIIVRWHCSSKKYSRVAPKAAGETRNKVLINARKGTNCRALNNFI